MKAPIVAAVVTEADARRAEAVVDAFLNGELLEGSPVTEAHCQAAQRVATAYVRQQKAARPIVRG